MRQYRLRLFLCIVPVLLSLWAIWYAWAHDRFKLGVDLSGGTILVYEIDSRKLAEVAKGDKAISSGDLAGRLAESLKRRIDPNDLYNIVIRPSKGEGRVEIILPTGGPERAERAEKQWANLLAKLSKEYDIQDLDINRGRTHELAERIQLTVAQRTWEQKLYKTPKDVEELAKAAEKTLRPLFQKRADEAALYRAEQYSRNLSLFVLDAWGGPLGTVPAMAYQAKHPPVKPAILKPLLEPGQKFTLPELTKEIKVRINDYAKEREVDAWFKEQAWAKVRKMLWDDMVAPKLRADLEQQVSREVERIPNLNAAERAERKKELLKKREEVVFNDRKTQFNNVLPDSFSELIGRAVTKGDSIGQAFAASLRSLMGDDLLTGKEFLDRTKVEQFLVENYGPSLESIETKIETNSEGTERGRDLTVEEVQRVKELVSKVGSLEFRILANNYDDKAAIEEARAMIANPSNKKKLEDLRDKGLPPPPPTLNGRPDGKPKEFDLTTLPRGHKSKVTYRWVELGKQERQQLNLNNAAKNAPGGNRAWLDMAAARDAGKAVELSWSNDPSGRKLLQGALFYSRRCTDRNLPEDERRAKEYEYFVLTRNPEIDPATGKETPTIDGSYLTNAASQMSEGRPAVSFTFNGTGGQLFRDLTRKNVPSGSGDETSQVKRHLAIVLDGLIQSAPTINSEIGEHGQISGNFTPREVDQLVRTLLSGALPATLKKQPVSESTMGATLGRDTIDDGLRAVAVAFIAVIVFMVVYYRFAGFVASVALLANLVITVGFMVAVSATFTLPGLAGLVLMLGMAVDANVLIYERLREERERGASLSLALRNGYDRAFPTIIDMHLCGIFTAVVLYVVGNDQLKGFGVSLTAGLIISLFTSLYMTRLMFDIWNSMGWLKKLSMFKLFSRPDIDFMAIRYYWFTATLVLTLGGMALFIGRLPNDLNIDFVGGTAYTGQLTAAKDIDQLRKLLSDQDQAKMLRFSPNSPEVKEVNAKENRYDLRYEMPNGKWTSWRQVILANAPEGTTKEQREQSLHKRARVLPDASVEQIFSSAFQEADRSKSMLFNVRTSEKEPELVQAQLDQLLQERKDDEWIPLLKKVEMKILDKDESLSQLATRREVRVEFLEPSPKEKGGLEPHYASPSFVRTLFTRQLLDQFKVKEARDLPFQFDLTTEGPTKEGRAKQMKFSFAPVSGNLSANQVARITTALTKTQAEFKERPQPERLETFDSQLAAETRLRAMYAILLSWGGILVYLWFRFGNWTFGLAAVLCLVHDLFFTLGIIAACHYLHGTAIGSFLLIEDFKIDLGAVAALLTLVGYSVNDTIVVFDRIREVRGKNPDLTPHMINDSVNQTLSRTLLTALTVWLVVFVLYVWGGPGLHLFAFVMLVGVMVGTYSSIYIASPLLLMFGEGTKATAKVRDRAPVPVGGGNPDVRIQSAQ